MVWNACYLLWVLLDERGLVNRTITISIAAYCAVFSHLCHVAQGSAQFYTFQARYVSLGETKPKNTLRPDQISERTTDRLF